MQHQRITLFQNLWLERLTMVSATGFAAVWAVLLPLIAVSGWGTVSVPAALALVAAGAIGWSLFEYATHRFLFHSKPGWPPMQRLVFLLHGNHHAQPDDRLRNLMPPIVSVPVAFAIWAGLLALFGGAGPWLALGFLSGYVMYDMVHYACHQWPMRGAIGRILKRHHMRHHHVDEGGNFAITTILWDRAFDTRITSLKRRMPASRINAASGPASSTE